MGAARGSGGAIAARLAHEGADVAVADRHDTLLQDTAKSVTALGQRTVALSVEVTATAQVAQAGPDAPGCRGTIVERCYGGGYLRSHRALQRLLRWWRHRQSSRELLATSEASWATTQSVGM